MATLSALRCNPAVRALYARVVAEHSDHKAIAVGHALVDGTAKSPRARDGN
jgi:hypothetical protein